MPPSRRCSAKDVELALEAVHQVIAECETNGQQVENDGVKGKGAISRCRNPFCQATLSIPFTRYCEDRTICQQYRALQLQCLVNAENVATLASGDIFAAERVAQHSNSKIAEDKEKSRPETPFIIPRRKRPSTHAVDSNVPSRKVKIRKTSNADRNAVQGTSQQAKSRLGHRMHFNDVLAFFEPQTPRAAAPSASTKTRAMRITEASRRARMAKLARRNGATPKPLPITRNLQDFGGGGRYVQSGNRSSLNSMRGLALISRPAYRPSPSSPVQVPAIPRTDGNVFDVAVSAEHHGLSTRQTPSVWTSAQNNSSSQSRHSARANFVTRRRPHLYHGEHTRLSRLRVHWQPGPLNNQQWTQAELQRASSENERNGYEHFCDVGVPVSPPPESENGRFARQSDASSLSTSREGFNFTGIHRPFTNNDSRFCARRELHCDGDFCSELRSNYDRGTAAGRIWGFNRERERDVTPTSGYSRIFPSQSEFGHGEDSIGADVRSAAHSMPTEEWSRYSQNNGSSEARAEQPGHQTVEPRVIKTAKAVQRGSSDATADCEPTFSFHDAFIQPLLLMFIQKLPSLLEPVTNVTKKPRKISWYTEYTKKIERACKPYLRIQLQTLQVVVKVQNRVWLKLKGSSTILLVQETLKTIRAQAISWRQLKAEFEECLELNRKRVGDDVEMSNVFLRAWNNFKTRRGPLSLPQQSNYFCGSHFHHWDFVVGKIEIGSGSHDEKREAFQLAAASAAEFLLQLDDNRNEQRWRTSPRGSYSSDTSEECEFLYVRGANNETVGADSVIALCESPDSMTEDVTIVDSTVAPQTTAGEKATTTTESTSHVDASSDTDTEDKEPPSFDASTAEDTTDVVTAASVEPTTSTSTGPTSLQDNAATKSRRCNMCDVIRMRKPDSAGCRRCQSARQVKT